MLQVLIIDDSIVEVDTYRQWLNKCGMYVLVANNAEQGIELAENEAPSVIVMEVVLPDLSGFQAIRILKSNPKTKSIPVVIASKKCQEADMTWGLRQGAQCYLAKPVSEALFMEHIQRVLPDIEEFPNLAYQN